MSSLNFTLIFVLSNHVVLLKFLSYEILERMSYIHLDHFKLNHSLNKHFIPIVHTLSSIAPHTLDFDSYANKNTHILGPSLCTQWHNRLGHPNHESLKVVLVSCNINQSLTFVQHVILEKSIDCFLSDLILFIMILLILHL